MILLKGILCYLGNMIDSTRNWEVKFYLCFFLPILLYICHLAECPTRGESPPGEPPVPRGRTTPEATSNLSNQVFPPFQWQLHQHEGRHAGSARRRLTTALAPGGDSGGARDGRQPWPVTQDLPVSRRAIVTGVCSSNKKRWICYQNDCEKFLL